MEPIESLWADLSAWLDALPPFGVLLLALIAFTLGALANSR